MRKLHSTVIAFLALAIIAGVDCKPVAGVGSTEKLNVLLIVLDDLNTSPGCYGNPVVKTPNIDLLAQRGARFDRAYCQFSLCNPSRASFLSGLRPETMGVLNNKTPPRKKLKDTVFLPELFRMHGYFTARVGKITHDKFSETVSWDISEGKDQIGSFLDPDCFGRDWCATSNRDEDELDGRVARRIVRLLEENRDRPFFISAGFSLPHSPWYAPKKYFDLYPLDQIPLPADFAASGAAAHEVRQSRAAYYASLSFVDAQIGLIIRALDRLSLTRNTVVVFTSDHGFHLGEHGGIFDKRTLFEESVRVPLIISAPGFPEAAVSPRILELVDLFPTLTELCGLPGVDGLEGISFVPLLGDPFRPWKTAAFSMTIKSKRFTRSVRTERYVYIEDLNGGKPRLYDHETDPQESVNQAKNRQYAEVLADMRRRLKEGWRGAVPPAP
jgi:uncharacterized sulfatase